MRDYTLVSPSLDGILCHEDSRYGDFSRPKEIQVIFDRPGLSLVELDTPQKKKTVELYWNDLYTVFLRRLTDFASQSTTTHHDAVKLQAMLQEMIKIKKLLADA